MITEEYVIELLRKRQGDRSQTDLAKELKCTPQFISDVINGRRRPSDKILGYLGLRREIVPAGKK